MNFLRAIFGIFLPNNNSDEIGFGDIDEDYYLSEPDKNMTGDSLDGGDVYNEPDYVIKY